MPATAKHERNVARSHQCMKSDWSFEVALQWVLYVCFYKWIDQGGGFQLENGQNCSHFTLSQRRENRQRSCSQFAAPMMVLYRKGANDLGEKLSNWDTNFARKICEVIARKGLNFLASFYLKDPPRCEYLQNLTAYLMFKSCHLY